MKKEVEFKFGLPLLGKAKMYVKTEVSTEELTLLKNKKTKLAIFSSILEILSRVEHYQ